MYAWTSWVVPPDCTVCAMSLRYVHCMQGYARTDGWSHRISVLLTFTLAGPNQHYQCNHGCSQDRHTVRHCCRNKQHHPVWRAQRRRWWQQLGWSSRRHCRRGGCPPSHRVRCSGARAAEEGTRGRWLRCPPWQRESYQPGQSNQIITMLPSFSKMA